MSLLFNANGYVNEPLIQISVIESVILASNWHNYRFEWF